jgi:hypothetical protein
MQVCDRCRTQAELKRVWISTVLGTEDLCRKCKHGAEIDSMVESQKETIATLEESRRVLYETVLPMLDGAGLYPEIEVNYYTGISIVGISREESMKIAGALGGALEKARSWSKEQEYNEAKFKLNGRIKGSKIDVSIRKVEPSESCTIEWTEELVPAHTRRVPKVVCKQPDPEPVEEPK